MSWRVKLSMKRYDVILLEFRWRKRTRWTCWFFSRGTLIIQKVRLHVLRREKPETLYTQFIRKTSSLAREPGSHKTAY
ncbi:MAG TPA: hypothetical protein ENF55_05335 [Thermoprotei archaeon]|nr:hypothetical protein [Thermoprotei archaeon]